MASASRYLALAGIAPQDQSRRHEEGIWPVIELEARLGLDPEADLIRAARHRRRRHLPATNGPVLRASRHAPPVGIEGGAVSGVGVIQRWASCCPDSTSQIRAVAAWLAVQTVRPSGLTVRAMISPALPRMSRPSRTPLARSERRTVPPWHPVTTLGNLGSKATAVIG